MKRPENLKLLEFLSSPLGQAVEPLRAAAMDRVEKYTLERLASMTAKLVLNGMDLNAVAFQPDPYGSRDEYYLRKAVRAMYMSITLPQERGSTTMAQVLGKAPHIVRVDLERCKGVVHDARQRASHAYDAFILKLCQKIGPHTAATLDGDHVWSYSVLCVTRTDGSVSRWKTQQITNVSKYGKVFAQWPSREMK